MGEIETLTAALTGRYEIEREIGQGGMATVYLARDLRHDRRVALKVLKPELGAVLGVDRFLAEIKVTANLQHPNLLPLFDSGEADGLLFYVMPFVDGESLRERVEREKQLPVDEAVRIAVAIANALEYAHGQGVIHRDLKPENILLQAGQPVIADFGIALAVSRAGGARVTQTGLSLGTPQYMSPEQATGDRAVDGRSDIYSLGAVTYEMLAGDPPHTASTAQAIVAKLLTEKPRSLRLTRELVPGHVEWAVERALAKLPADRWATPHEFAEALQGRMAPDAGRGPSRAAATGADVAAHLEQQLRLGRRVLTGVGAVAVVAIAAALWLLGAARREQPGTTARFLLTFEPNERHVTSATGTPFAISPDGKTIAYAATRGGGAQRLYVRPLSDLRARELPGTDGGIQPTFSPDGRWIAFLSGAQVKKTPVEGGTPVLLANVPGARGMSWGTLDDIVVGGTGRGLVVVPAKGGALHPLTRPTEPRSSDRWPLVLNDGKTVIFSEYRAGGSSRAHLAITSLDGGAATTLDLVSTLAIGMIDDQLVYSSAGGALMAVPFDVAGRRVTGTPTPVVDQVFTEPSSGVVLAALSAGGSLVYQTGTSVSTLVVGDAHGTTRSLALEPRAYGFPRFSPNGRRIAVAVTSPEGQSVWIHDRSAGTFARFTTTDAGPSSRAEWSPDGTRLLFYVSGAGLLWQPSDNGGPATPLVAIDSVTIAEGVLSPDGQTVLFRATGATVSNDLWYRRVADPASTRPFLTSPFYETAPRFSPNGRWVAYSSDETGTRQVYVTAFPGPGPHFQVSTDGGDEPVWAPDGRRLFYVHDRQLVAAMVTLEPGFALGNHEVLFEGNFVFNYVHANYDVSPDGKEFLLLKESGGAPQVVYVHDWRSELRARKKAKGD